MSVAVKSFLTAGVALVGAVGLVATPVGATPVGGPGLAERSSSAPYALTAAASSLANVGVNVFNMVMSIPAWEIQAMGRAADAMIVTGSWQVWGPTNVFGFDEEDPPKLAALIDMLIPIQPFSSVVGDQLSWWARANLPMNAGCAAAHNACPDPKAMLDSMFRAPLSDLYRGYQFPAVTNPFTGVQTSWSGQYVKLDRKAAVNAVRDYLTAPPVGVATVSSAEVVGSITRLAKSFNDAFYPFVQNSQWFDNKHTAFAPLFRALAPVLCASCDPTNPYDNEWLKNYPQKPAGAKASAAVPVAAAIPANVMGGVVGAVDPESPASLSVPGSVAVGEKSALKAQGKSATQAGAHLIGGANSVVPKQQKLLAKKSVAERGSPAGKTARSRSLANRLPGRSG